MKVKLENIPIHKGIDIHFRITSFNGCESDCRDYESMDELPSYLRRLFC